MLTRGPTICWGRQTLGWNYRTLLEFLRLRPHGTHGTTMFEGFKLETIPVTAGQLRVRHGGSGPPVLLLHGHPRTHVTWWKVAERLADTFRVICRDLPGFGQSYVPQDTPDHSGSSKRAKAAACVELMGALGHNQFAVVGHDRGAYTAFRLAMDHPDSVTHLVVLDAVPILEALERTGEQFAGKWWHWFFFAVPDKPERAILADPDAWYGGEMEPMGQAAYDDFRAATAILPLFTVCLKTTGLGWVSIGNTTSPVGGPPVDRVPDVVSMVQVGRPRGSLR